MHPVLFKIGSLTIYTYGFFIALGAVLGGLFLWRQGKKQYRLTFDQANSLFLLLIIGGVVGGKVFLIFESPRYYFSHPAELFSQNGFVFYGSLLTDIPLMLWFFRKNKLPILGMLDIMAAVTCIVHGLGRIGCFNAGCCYGKPTTSWAGVIFTDTVCQAQPLNTPLHPTQLYEAILIFSILLIVLFIHRNKTFNGQAFLSYLILYAAGRAVIEQFRGDTQRGFVIENVLSISQFISILLIGIAIFFYVKLKRSATFP
ncbi:MAG: prolipoprotein diacylglyceryl transferase [Bacteroidetes bacterium]|nr:prolipoprotein diacylglyceryl transferase [Bacteroidota bacterium]MBS1539946.1 prolipoprotein diacylglyceryl transferase [Bacteroidota bacterium]